MRWILFLSALALLAAPGVAQTTEKTDAEQAVQQTISADGVHVVHFWAPWCGNSMSELRGGLYEVVEQNPDVTFTFVTIRNGADAGADTLERYGIPDRVQKLVQPSGARERTFLDWPVSWTPTTWVFNRGGKLAYAFNYGEISVEQLSKAIADAQNEWHHE